MGLALTLSGLRAEPLSNQEMVAYLTQSLCLDRQGNVTNQVPEIDNCAAYRPQLGNDQAIYTKRDWPDHHYFPHYILTGHQQSDSVLYGSVENPYIEQTLDFGGDAGHKFGRVDREDGGQAVVIAKNWASIPMTEDLNSGVAWFVGEGCNLSSEDAKLGWLLFNRDVPTGHWAEIWRGVATSHTQRPCPRNYGKSYIRFRREQVSFPFRLIDGEKINNTSRDVSAVISEHYGNSNDIRSARGLERFYFARHLGWIRWERWENLAIHDDPKFLERARNLETSQRCPDVNYSSSPGPGWVQVGCRNWTTIVKNSSSWSVDQFDWRAFKATLPQQLH